MYWIVSVNLFEKGEYLNQIMHIFVVLSYQLKI